ncbi:MAG: hypothetical protein U0527_01625 [Candidatus Eisenbacteria bacterium]
MNSRRARRAALRFWFSAALLAALSLAPLAPAFAWTPPPKPLPTQPADTDGIDDDLDNQRTHREDNVGLTLDPSRSAKPERSEAPVEVHVPGTFADSWWLPLVQLILHWR